MDGVNTPGFGPMQATVVAVELKSLLVVTRNIVLSGY